VSRALVTLALLAVTLVAFAVSLAQGEFAIPIADVVATLVGAGPPGADFIVLELRLPRAIVGALTGAALALSGLIFQTLVRNPLASPDIIGITTGAAFAGVSIFILGAASFVLPFAAFAGALAAAALVYVLAWRRGLSPYRFVLVGIGIQAVALAGIYYMLERGQIEFVVDAYVWLVGSLSGRTFGDVWPLLAGLTALLPVAAALARPLDALALGDETARGLGVAVERARLALVVTASALAALAVAAAGPIGFVAFLAPHIARRLTRAPGAAAMPAAALSGAALVLAADLAGRVVMAPDGLPAGILTSMLGAPFFLYLLYRTNRVRAVA
jgi:iron complex transport system permease protein